MYRSTRDRVRARNVPHERSRRHVRAERTPKMILAPIIIFARHLESCQNVKEHHEPLQYDPERLLDLLVRDSYTTQNGNESCTDTSWRFDLASQIRRRETTDI